MMTEAESNSGRHRRVVVTRYGGPEVLQVVEEERPEPGPGEVRVKVQVAGVSAYDLMLRRFRLLPGTPRIPFTLGTDIVGIVDKVDDGISTVAPGQQVAAATFSLGGTGGYAEFICLPANELVPVPEGVDPAEAICLIANYLTAHMALHRVANVQSGQRVLIHGAAGGVGTALLQLGKLAGLEMYGTASSYNHDLVSALGATPIDYRAEDFVTRIRAFTGEGVEVVFDPIGGARQLWRSHQALRKKGRLVWIGVAGAKRKGLWVIPGSIFMTGLLALMPGGKQVGLFPDLGEDNAWYRATLTDLLDLLAEGRLQPVVAARIPLVGARRAHELLERGGYAGKVVLITDV
jgi:NADPH2:quinone reductase